MAGQHVRPVGDWMDASPATKPDAPGAIMTIAEVAAYLRLSEATIYKLAQGRRIPATKIGRAWRFPKQLIDEWVRQRASL